MTKILNKLEREENAQDPAQRLFCSAKSDKEQIKCEL